MSRNTKKHITDLIWLQTAFIGDIILITGAIELVAQEFPGIRQHVISTPAGCEILKGSSHLHERIPFAKRSGIFEPFRSVKAALRKAGIKPETSVLMQVHASLRSTLLSRYLGMHTVTYTHSVLGFLADERIERDPHQHELVRVASLLQSFDISPERIASVRAHLDALPLLEEVSWQHALKGFSGKLVGLAVGSHWATKRWPIEHYAALASLLLTDPNIGLVLIGSPDEKPLCDELAHTMLESEQCWNLAGQTNFDDLRRVFPKLSLVISNDSSPVHFASAFNIPTLAIFGPTVPAFGFGPRSDRSDVQEHKSMPCRPCSPHGPQYCPLGHFRCMRDLPAGEVYAAAKELL